MLEAAAPLNLKLELKGLKVFSQAVIRIVSLRAIRTRVITCLLSPLSPEVVIFLGFRV